MVPDRPGQAEGLVRIVGRKAEGMARIAGRKAEGRAVPPVLALIAPMGLDRPTGPATTAAQEVGIVTVVMVRIDAGPAMVPPGRMALARSMPIGRVP
jgi:hypothetical protein